MNITIAPNGYLQIDDATLLGGSFRNFSGAASKFNREGDRNFAFLIPDQEAADLLMNDVNEYGVGWNVKIKPPRDEDDEPFMYLTVKVKFNSRGPKVYLQTGDVVNELDEDTISCLDDIDIARVDFDVRPYDDSFNGKPFRSAYLYGMHVIQANVDRFGSRFRD